MFTAAAAAADTVPCSLLSHQLELLMCPPGHMLRVWRWPPQTLKWWISYFFMIVLTALLFQ